MSDVLIDGINAIADRDAAWTQSVGVQPVVLPFDVPLGAMDEFVRKSRTHETIELVLGAGTDREQTFSNLFVLATGPADDPRRGLVYLGDIRWLLPYLHVLRRFNMRRTIGTQRIVRRGAERVAALQPIEPELAYAEWSINPATDKPYTAAEIIDDVLVQLARGVRDILDGAAVLDAMIEPEIVDPELASLSTDNTVIDDDGAQALARALALLPGANATVDVDGTLRIFSSVTRQDEALVEALGEAIVGTGNIEIVSNAYRSPREIHVLFSRAVELRADFDSTADVRNLSRGAATRDRRFLQNVMPNPDWSIMLRGQEHSEHSYIDIDDALVVYNQAGVPGSLAAVSHDVMQRAFLPGIDLFAAMELSGNLSLDSDEQNWAARVMALRRHYRRTFMFNPRWMDRVLRLEPRRVSVVNPETGTRAASLALCDYAWKHALHAVLRQARAGRTSQRWAANVRGYPRGPVLNTISPFPSFTSGELAAIAAPATVQLLPGDQGVFTLTFETDHEGQREIVYRSALENIPEYPPRPGATVPWVFNEELHNETMKLSTDHKVALVFTAYPAAPNSVAQLHRVVVRPETMVSSLGIEGGQSGPIREVRVGPEITRALIGWTDEDSRLIDRIFGVGGPAPTTEELDPIVLNRGGDAGGVASLEAVARAVAASIWVRDRSRPQGVATYPMFTEPRGVVGELESLTHAVSPGGGAFTQVRFAPQADPLSFFAFLDASTRRLITRELSSE